MNAKQLKGKSTTLSVLKDNAVVFTQVLNFNSEEYFQTITPLLDAKKTGLQQYKIKLSALENEVTLVNNTKDIFIDVLGGREKVLILCDAPHPDVSAIKEAIQVNKNYEVESYAIENFNQSIKKYNLIVLHHLPSKRNFASKILTEINESSIPIWSFSGSEPVYNKNVQKTSFVQKSNEVEPVLEQNFPLFTLSDELRKAISIFPAVSSPFAAYQNDHASDVLLYQKIGVVETKTPLMLFNSSKNNKTAVFAGEGIWKWRLYDFAINGNHNVFNEFVSKTVQYLSVKEDKSFFRVTGANSFMENETVELNAEVYNKSYELINEPEINTVITNSENKNFSYTFSKTSNAYQLNAGVFPVGEYAYTATTKIGANVFHQKGVFHVSPLQVELTKTTADHQLLYNLASKQGGELVYPNNLLSLYEKLNAREDVKTVSYSHKKLSDLINLKWLFLLIILLLSLEWFIRKRSGAY